MLATTPQRIPTISEEDLATEESRLNHLALFGGVAVTLVTVMALFLAMPMAEETWQYLMYSALGGVPLIHGMFSSFVLRRMHVIALHGYQSQLLTRISELQELVFRDELTGLHNRRHFYDVANDTVPKTFESKTPLAILLMDLDGLKGINDEYGHGVGDVVIATLGRILAKHIRGRDVAARLGGDEFGVIMQDTDKRGAFALARRLWEELESTPVQVDAKTELMVTVSIGVAGYPWGGESLEEMLQWADADMYANKVSRRLPKHEIEDAGAELDPVLDDYVVGN
jgi:diguanylate cyclase (GGDEF)-like protein